MSKQPELTAPPEIFYNDVQAKKYTYSNRIINIQEKMCYRAIELLMLPKNKKHLLLDIGCGSGLSGNVIDSEGYLWIGMDISSSMLKIATNCDVKGDLILSDMGHGVPFRAGTIDGAVSISALQWLCNLDNTKQFLQKRLKLFFGTLFAALSNGGRAVFQFYPQNDAQVNIITTAASAAGFFGGLVVDYPNSKKAKKNFLVLMTSNYSNLTGSIATYNTSELTNQLKSVNQKFLKCRKTWILRKKEKFREKGKIIKKDSKYTGRSRRNYKF